ncbi:MAG: sigma-70 family RNA polymerase sigma factor [Betaproteobacteria bacterium]|nr:MAG: sigma-70 family RNA polymerase sigma factor [Betaproteobacteria bacterium]TMH68687.1 MAG: sigma-70 family RNA polymerase sigma factor [Betaproteobacteria bacterium]
MPASTGSSKSSGRVRPPHQLFAPPRVIVDDDTDRVLVGRYRNGDRAAFAEIVIRYQRPIYNAAFWVLRSVEDAQDVAQIVFLKVAERLDEYDGQYKFFSWIYRIAVNESLNLLRRHGREEPLDDEIDLPDADSANPESKLNDAQVSKRIQSALMTMSANDRLVLTLRHFSECSYQEIAEILDVDEKTVKSRLFEARHRLRDLLVDLHQH